MAAAFQPFRSQYTDGAFNDTVPSTSDLLRRLTEMTVFVAESEGCIVGTIACSKLDAEEGHLRGMAVLPQWQALGVAKVLLAAAETELRDHGCKRVTLDTTEPLQRAIRFYEKNGYQPTGRISDFFGMRLQEYCKAL